MMCRRITVESFLAVVALLGVLALAAPLSAQDCNDDGVADACETGALGCPPDPSCTACDAQHPGCGAGVCNGDYLAASPAYSPVGGGMSRTYDLGAVPLTTGEVTVTVQATGDLADPTKFLHVLLNGAMVGAVFDDPTAQCPATPESRQLLLSAAQYNSLVDDGDGDRSGGATFELVAIGEPDPDACSPAASTVAMTVSYPVAEDCDANLVPDVCEGDDDGDGVLNPCDPCPDDPLKTDPGTCGCGIEDSPENLADDDGDGAVNCLDPCPADPGKVDPLVCGCGVADEDGDGDGFPDCCGPIGGDCCPDDVAKTEPGECGCGAADVDSDGDGFLDCFDNCPEIPNPNQEDADLDCQGDDCDFCFGDEGVCGCDVFPAATCGDGGVAAEGSRYLDVGLPTSLPPDDMVSVRVTSAVCSEDRFVDLDGDFAVRRTGRLVPSEVCHRAGDLTRMHVTGELVVPETEYTVEYRLCSGDPNEPFVPVGTATTGVWGDVDLDATVNISDVTYVVSHYNGTCSADRVWLLHDLVGVGGCEPDGAVTLEDLDAAVAAFQGPYENLCPYDPDGDGTASVCESCPDDPGKLVPGICGCGVADSPENVADDDGDGVVNCNDPCPDDPDNVNPGVCGCGVVEVDSDGDGYPDCCGPVGGDCCPDDADKVEAGVCGCGVPDDDLDGDGLLRCEDNCPDGNNPGQEDADLDCQGDVCDACFGDEGACGCGVFSAPVCGDGGVAAASSRYLDLGVPLSALAPDDLVSVRVTSAICPEGRFVDKDPGFSATRRTGRLVTSEVCHRAEDMARIYVTGELVVPETEYTVEYRTCTPSPTGPFLPVGAATTGPWGDIDGDGTTNISDVTYVVAAYSGSCNASRLWFVHDLVGVGGCEPDGVLTQEDLDAAVSAVFHGPFELLCPYDDDGDGVANDCDGCPDDPGKIDPGVCGCGVDDSPENLADDDGDGVVNCLDPCPGDPLKVDPLVCGCGVADDDTDGDGYPDCCGTPGGDCCPLDPLKTEPGVCGCGTPDDDLDVDGLLRCLDNCPDVFNPDQEDADLDCQGDACDACFGDEGACGCGVFSAPVCGDGGVAAASSRYLDLGVPLSALAPDDLVSVRVTSTLCPEGRFVDKDPGFSAVRRTGRLVTSEVCHRAEDMARIYVTGELVVPETEYTVDYRTCTPEPTGPFLSIGSATTLPWGDIDGDGTTNISDVTYVVNAYSGSCNASRLWFVHDLVGVDGCEPDGILTQEDLDAAVSAVFHGPFELLCPYDDDGDGVANDCDGCPDDPGKVDPGVCGCGVGDSPENLADDDGDGVVNCLDPCPDDPGKVDPLVCGCGVPDDDMDGDGYPDCCGAPGGDCCPLDPLKIDPGVCGCGTPDDDLDGDGLLRCEDNCPDVPNPGQEDADLDCQGDACDACFGDEGACGCGVFSAPVCGDGGVAAASSRYLDLGVPLSALAPDDLVSVRVTSAICPEGRFVDKDPGFSAIRRTGRLVTSEVCHRAEDMARIYVTGELVVPETEYTVEYRTCTPSPTGPFLPVGSATTGLWGDVNGNGGTNISDVTYVVAAYSGSCSASRLWFVYDLVGVGGCEPDGVLTQEDLDAVVSAVFEGPFELLCPYDDDGDGIANDCDGCPDDPGKIDPGVCDCGVDDSPENLADDDGDGVINCLDPCSSDPLKVDPLVCGCGVPDDDTDGDGYPDCCGTPGGDCCPLDPLKIDPGVCGCGVADDDLDGDGLLRCEDNCPDVPNPGQEDADLDCQGDACDACFGDEGACGCGVFPAPACGDGGVASEGSRYLDLGVPLSVLGPDDMVSVRVSSALCPEGRFVDKDPDFSPTRRIGHLVTTEVCHRAEDLGRIHVSGELIVPETEHTVEYRTCTPEPSGPFLPIGSATTGTWGDVNGDGVTTIADVTWDVNAFSGSCTTSWVWFVHDLVGVGSCEPDRLITQEDLDAAVSAFQGPFELLCPFDDDGDGAANFCELCPDDPLKVEPLVCGCGVAEDDTDGDGAPDCCGPVGGDCCPADPGKVDPLVCGCGIPDTDADGDGAPDCCGPVGGDCCPADPGKVDPGVCGCGVADVDTDGDGLLDCEDNCPLAANPGQEDGDADCLGDACDTCFGLGDPGPCGCGVFPAPVCGDGGVAGEGSRYLDLGAPADAGEWLSLRVSSTLCPEGRFVTLDPDFSSSRRTAGLGEVEVCYTAADLGRVHVTGDILVPSTEYTVEYRRCTLQGLPNPNAPFVPIGSATTGPWGDVNGDGYVSITDVTRVVGASSGMCVLNRTWFTHDLVCLETCMDTCLPDGDVTLEDAYAAVAAFEDPDGFPDLCPVDGDGDGVASVCEECPADPVKTEPGVCGCGEVEDVADDDGDGTVNCLDGCPLDPAKTAPGICGCGEVEDVADDDGDGTVNCLDGCPLDAGKTEPGVCGCGVPDSAENVADDDGDGVPFCLDNCPSVANPSQEASDGDALGDACDNCPLDDNPDQDNTDGDCFGDACDVCTADPSQTDTSPCGCGIFPAPVCGDGGVVAEGSHYLGIGVPLNVLASGTQISLRLRSSACPQGQFVDLSPAFATQHTGVLVTEETCRPAEDFGFIHVTGDLLLPETEHTAEYRLCDAQGQPDPAASFVEIGTATTWKWGDVDNNGSTNISDVTWVVDAYVDLCSVTGTLFQYDLVGPVSCEGDGAITQEDLDAAVDAFQGPYETVCPYDSDGDGVADACDDCPTGPNDVNGNGYPDCTEAVLDEGSRYLAVTPQADPGVPAAPIALHVASPDFSCLGKWVSASGGLVALPVYQTPAAWSTVHVKHLNVVPDTTYEIHFQEQGQPGLYLLGSVTTWIYGDVNHDGVVTSADLTAVQNAAAGDFGDGSLYTFDLAGAAALDCLPNGVVDQADIDTVESVLMNGTTYPTPGCLLPCEGKLPVIEQF